MRLYRPHAFRVRDEFRRVTAVETPKATPARFGERSDAFYTENSGATPVKSCSGKDELGIESTFVLLLSS